MDKCFINSSLASWHILAERIVLMQPAFRLQQICLASQTCKKRAKPHSIHQADRGVIAEQSGEKRNVGHYLDFNSLPFTLAFSVDCDIAKEINVSNFMVIKSAIKAICAASGYRCCRVLELGCWAGLNYIRGYLPSLDRLTVNKMS